MAAMALTSHAHALFELRLGYGLNEPDEKSFGPEARLTTLTGFNLDAIAEIPLIPVGLGLRHERLSSALKGIGGASPKAELQRTSFLVNYRFIDLFFYLGLIGTIGVQNQAVVKNFPGSGDLKYKSDLTTSLGVEGGVSLGTMMLGAELGYLHGNLENTGQNVLKEFSMEGIYAKVLVGVGF